MNVLIADKLPEGSLSGLVEAGHHVVEVIARGDALKEALHEHQAQILVVRSTKVDRDALAASSALELIVRAGAGYDSIDVQSASERGIYVANCPGKNASAVAELTIGLMLALDRRIPDNVRAAHEGQWDKATFASARGLKGRTLGIVGMGNIGKAVVRRAIGLHMRVVAWSRSLTAQAARSLGVAMEPSPEAVAAVSDVVSLHVAATPDTRHLAGKAFFAAMKPGALFINTTRGSVVDEAALLQALDEKQIRAGLDVFDGEPSYKQGALDGALAAHPNVYLTHHIGASTAEAQEATAAEAVRVIKVYAETGRVPNCVNIAAQSAATHLLTVRHLDRIGVLAAVLDEIRQAQCNVQEMDNMVFAGSDGAACARIWVSGTPSIALLDKIRSLEHVLAASLITL